MNAPGCSGKTRYATQAEAQRARRGLAEKDTIAKTKRRRKAIAEGLNVYRCANPDCDGWHLGRQRTLKGPRRPYDGPNSLRALARRYWEAAEGVDA